jgi:hypothetical protein
MGLKGFFLLNPTLGTGYGGPGFEGVAPGMKPWTWWIYVPVMNWLPWIFAASKTRDRSWARYAALYAAPLVVAMLSSDFVSTDTEEFLGGLYVLSWIGGMVHWTLIKESIFEVISRLSPIKTGPAEGSSQKSSTTEPQIIERVIIREIVKIPCPYCGELNENTQAQCGRCGAGIR